MNDYFDYPVPFWREIKKECPYPYKFSDDLMDKLDAVFLSPTHKWGVMYSETRRRHDVRMMAQVLYSYVVWARENMAQIGGAIDNIIPQITVTMWRKWLMVQKRYGRVEDFDRYYATHVKNLRRGVARMVEEMVRVIDNGEFVAHMDDMVKRRQGVGLRERRKPTQEGSKRFEYYADSE